MNKTMKRNLIIAAVALVLVVALILVVVLVPWGSFGPGSTMDEIDPGIDMTTDVNSDGLHTAKINTNHKGEIENNSYGTLIDYVPAQIDKISVRSGEGNYTFLLETPVDENGKTKATIFTLEGFEDYDLAATSPSLLASAVCNIDFTKVADLGENAKEYGFDNPRSEATVYYNDGTHSVVRLGDNAPGGSYCYIQFGDNDTVYVAVLADMEAMLLNITDLFNTSINSDATSVSDDSFDVITLGGTHLKEEVSIVANTEGSLDCYYLMSSHGNKAVSAIEGANVIGSIKSLVADSVVCVNPDSAQLKEFGLANPYATVKTSYSYTDSEYDSSGNEISSEDKVLNVSLMASEQDGEGFVYMMEEGGKLVYKIAAKSVSWATTSMEKLTSEYVLTPVYEALSGVEFDYNGKSYAFDISFTEVTETDDTGATTTSTEAKVSCAGKTIDPDMFYIMYQDLTLMEIGGSDSGTEATGELFSVTYKYSTSRPDDKVVFSLTDTQKVIATVNGDAVGYVYKNYVSALAENIVPLADAKGITSVR